MKPISQFLSETDLYLFDRGDAQRAYYTFGSHPLPQAGEDAWIFAVWAPHAKSVTLVGDFNDWNEAATPLVHVHNGVYACVVEGLHDGDLYKYCIVGPDGKSRLKADPFAFHAENGLSTASKVWDLSGYDWHDGAYLERRAAGDPHKEPLSIYEFHLGSWRLPDGDPDALPNYRAVAHELADYCVKMGYTHVEPMPLTEYPFPASWGYQTTGYYAITSRYGTPQDFMYFVDTLHEHGIGVIMDWVPAHFPRDAFALASFDGAPLYEYADPRKGEHAEWGTLVFDYGKPQVVSFLVSSAMFLFDLYHIDGIRVDAVSSMLYLDYGRTEWIPNKDGGNINLEAVAFFQKLNSAVLGTYPGVSTIAEESTAFPMVTMPPYVGGLGFTFKWNMGFMHDTLDYVATDPFFRAGNHYKMTFSMDYAYSEAFILEFSHDEVVYGKKSMIDKMFGSYDQKFSTLRALMGYQFAHPGKKLTFMGSEFAQFSEWNFKKQLDWDLLDFPAHRQMQAFSAALNEVYRTHAALWLDDMDPAGFAWANRDNRDENALAFLRNVVSAEDLPEDDDCTATSVLCCCNFSPNPIKGLVVGLPAEGMLVEAFNSDDERFGGSGKLTNGVIYTERGSFEGSPYRARVDVPPLGAVYFEYKKRKGIRQMKEREESVAMILAGGQGSRLGVLTRFRAKPAVPYGGKYRIIDFPLSNCSNSGIGVVGVLTQYEPFALNSYIGTGAPWDLDSPTGGVYVLSPYTRVGDVGEWYAGTADAVFQNIDFIDRYAPEYLVVLSGDHIYKMDYSRMIDFHKAHDADATIAVMPVPIEEASRFGILDADDTGRITDFVEKPENPPNNLASMGVYVFSWDKARYYLVADAENSDSSHDFGKNVIPAMLGAGEKLFAYQFEGYWRDVGTVGSLWEANMDLLEEEPSLDLSDDAWKIYARNPFMPAALVGEGSTLDTCLVPEGCDIDGDVVHSVLFQGVDVGVGASVADSVVMSGSQVEQSATIERAILAEDVVVGEGARVGGPGDLCVLGAGSYVMPGAVVAPGETVEPGAVVEPKGAKDDE
ncbi:1,4-alpha-glucan branching protein GlgB [Xiamenia xianingshaonis]|uniref:1,4-alpha-glucan branching protein GlgB n=1 Tax=Xiamenia xianingshaonis TaxID=2682776 RepID=UPI0028F70506|nr:1,4-alpha-glucan branching protein GlgB [Xiamenia xianingshaonis]